MRRQGRARRLRKVREDCLPPCSVRSLSSIADRFGSANARPTNLSAHLRIRPETNGRAEEIPTRIQVAPEWARHPCSSRHSHRRGDRHLSGALGAGEWVTNTGDAAELVRRDRDRRGSGPGALHGFAVLSAPGRRVGRLDQRSRDSPDLDHASSTEMRREPGPLSRFGHRGLANRSDSPSQKRFAVRRD